MQEKYVTKDLAVRKRQYLSWREDGEKRQLLLMPNELTEFLEIAEQVDQEYAFERIIGCSVDGKHEITLIEEYVLTK